MRYAETGFNLEVDLTRGSIERVQTDPIDTELYLGGLGTNAKILWDRVPPEIEPFSPDNLLIFAAGLLCGTPATGCNRTIVSTISPQTLLMAFSMMGGFWAPELKYAGYDKVISAKISPTRLVRIKLTSPAIIELALERICCSFSSVASLSMFKLSD